MSHALQPTFGTSSNQIEAEEIVWPEFNPSPQYRNFIERLKRARIERGLSIGDMAGEVGLTFRLANEFETLAAPLPFCHLELWCQVVGVPFEDYLAIYWADERAWDERQAREREAEQREAEQREAEQREAEQKAPCITDTESGEQKAPALSRSPRGFGFLNLLRSLVAHIRDRFLSLFSTPKKTPK